MKIEDMRVGAFYIIAGGNLLRYHGLYGNNARNLPNCSLAFQEPSNSLSDPPCGPSIGADEVLYEITHKDLGWLDDRRAQMVARGLSVEELDHMVQEIKARHSS